MKAYISKILLVFKVLLDSNQADAPIVLFRVPVSKKESLLWEYSLYFTFSSYSYSMDFEKNLVGEGQNLHLYYIFLILVQLSWHCILISLR